MAILESLIGRPLHELDDAELEEIIMRGRLAREEESAGARGRVKKTGTGAKKKAGRLDDVPDLDFDLDDIPDLDDD